MCLYPTLSWSHLYVLVEVQELQQNMEVSKEEDGAKEEVRMLTSRVAELEDVNKQLTGRLQQEQAAHEVSTHLQVVVMCMYIQMTIIGILQSQSASYKCAHYQFFFVCFFLFEHNCIPSGRKL